MSESKEAVGIQPASTPETAVQSDLVLESIAKLKRIHDYFKPDYPKGMEDYILYDPEADKEAMLNNALNLIDSFKQTDKELREFIEPARHSILIAEQELKENAGKLSPADIEMITRRIDAISTWHYLIATLAHDLFESGLDDELNDLLSKLFHTGWKLYRPCCTADQKMN